ncbi:hypothetical protein TB1_016143 [Malus domestica]
MKLLPTDSNATPQETNQSENSRRLASTKTRVNCKLSTKTRVNCKLINQSNLSFSCQPRQLGGAVFVNIEDKNVCSCGKLDRQVNENLTASRISVRPLQKESEEARQLFCESKGWIMLF